MRGVVGALIVGTFGADRLFGVKFFHAEIWAVESKGKNLATLLSLFRFKRQINKNGTTTLSVSVGILNKMKLCLIWHLSTMTTFA